MNKQEINISVAESMGWRDFQVYSNGVVTGTPKDGNKETTIPCYTSDLNAISDACEKKFGNSDAWEVYSLNLTKVYWGEENLPVCPLSHNMAGLRADTLQRCEAYLLTLGKLSDASTYPVPKSAEQVIRGLLASRANSQWLACHEDAKIWLEARSKTTIKKESE